MSQASIPALCSYPALVQRDDGQCITLMTVSTEDGFSFDARARVRARGKEILEVVVQPDGHRSIRSDSGNAAFFNGAMCVVVG